MVLAGLGHAFVGFPVDGSAAFLLLGPIESTGEAAVGGALAGAAIGTAQWLVLRRRLPLSALWVPATAAGMALGLTLGQVVLAYDTSAVPLLLRGLVTGAAIGAAQAVLLRGVLPTPLIWAAVVTVGWAVTAAFGVNLAEKWAVFGMSGALVFQLVTGLTLAYLLRHSVHTRHRPTSAVESPPREETSYKPPIQRAAGARVSTRNSPAGGKPDCCRLRPWLGTGYL